MQNVPFLFLCRRSQQIECLLCAYPNAKNGTHAPGLWTVTADTVGKEEHTQMIMNINHILDMLF